MDTAPDAWEPGDYRAPTCATCHMSGIGELSVTHNVTERLYWNLWAKYSPVRGSDDMYDIRHGDGPAGREKMKMVCNNCHSSTHTNGFFAQGDKAVKLYNEAYYKPATAMLDELKEKGLAQGESVGGRVPDHVLLSLAPRGPAGETGCDAWALLTTPTGTVSLNCSKTCTSCS